MNQHSQQDGFTLVGMLVALAMLGIAAVAVMTTTGQNVTSMRFARSSRSFLDIDHTFSDALTQALRGNACFDPAHAFANVPIGSFGSMKFSQQVIAGAGDLQGAGNLKVAIDSARSRCVRPRSSSGSRYFCVDFPFNASAPPDSFLNSQFSFGEIFVETRNLQTNQPVACSTLNGSGGVVSGGLVYYSLYWRTGGRKGGDWIRHNGSFYIGK